MRLAGRGGDGGHAAEPGEGRFGAEPVGVIADRDEQGPRRVGAQRERPAGGRGGRGDERCQVPGEGPDLLAEPLRARGDAAEREGGGDPRAGRDPCAGAGRR